jgi:hypothetical protein
MTDHALHLIARIVVRFCSPKRACAILGQVGALLPPRGSRVDILRAGARIRGRGTCLTRSLAMAARAPLAEVVVALTSRPGERLKAHAWLELSGEPIDPSEVEGRVIARIRPARWARGGEGRTVRGLSIDSL